MSNLLSLSIPTAHATTPQVSTSYTDNNYGGHFPLSSPAFDSAVTAFASRVLRINSPPEACFDSSVASYVITTLRDANDDTAVQYLDEYQSLLELLEEHCNMTADTARRSLQTIANAVRTGVFDDGENGLSTSVGSLGGMINLGGSHVGSRLGRYRSKSVGAEVELNHDDDAISLLNNMLRNTGIGSNSNLLATLGATPEEGGEQEETSFFMEEDELPRTPAEKGSSYEDTTPLTSEETSLAEDWILTDDSNVHVSRKTKSMTPLKPDRLIPIGLLGILDDPSTPRQNTREEVTVTQTNEITTQNLMITSCQNTSEKSTSVLPPAVIPSTKGNKKKSKAKSKDLAAALFCSTRSRSNSLQVEKSPKLQPMMTPNIPSFRLSSENSSSSNGSSSHMQKQVDSAVQILMALNYDICEEAAYEAALVSNADVNVAQYVIDGAMSAPPVCRHMLNDGCYRSDCQFSHDVEGHTCSFWLRGRCGKGDSCRFMHGFSLKLLDGVKCKTVSQQNPSLSPTNTPSKPIPIKTSNLVQHNSASFASPNLASSHPNPIKTSNLLQHNMKTSFSFAGNGERFDDMNKDYVQIPKDLLNTDYNCSQSAFYVEDPLERYKQVSLSTQREDVIDLHFQSTNSFSSLLSSILPGKLRLHGEVWILCGTGHSNQNIHQKSGVLLERSVIGWLISNGYTFLKGKDNDVFGGAVLVKR